MQPSQRYSLDLQSPFAGPAGLFVCLLVPASYIPQLIDIAKSHQAAHSAISGWYIILLSISATAHLAARLDSIHSFSVWQCVRHGEIKGLKGVYVLVRYIQLFVRWVAAMILLAFYVAFCTGASSRQEGYASTAAPSNTAILAIVLSHAVITLPSALYHLHKNTDEDGPFNDIVICLLQASLQTFLQITGILTSLMAFIPQIHLMLTRPRDGRSSNQDSPSTISLGFQAIAFTLLAVSQGWRTRPPHRRADPESWWVRLYFSEAGLRLDGCRSLCRSWLF
ncbi:hypothetical protein BJY04DRAFT_222183 [Aspergillus karnatakaensis]|uniref:uncharacterized protein n=1 Tax=Aspergillus karnatakaensis TaxID=1810916 RepID=UPI003CCDAB25